MISRTHTDELNRLGGLNGDVEIVSGAKFSGPVTATSLQVSTAQVLTGNGSPEGVVVAPLGSMYLNLNGGTGKSLWVKEIGAGSTGWAAK